MEDSQPQPTLTDHEKAVQATQPASGDMTDRSQRRPRRGFTDHHWADPHGKPSGGCSFGTGFAISWQMGPLGRGADQRRDPNGAFVEDIIAAARSRIAWYQTTEFDCEENAQAIDALTAALEALNRRTEDRVKREVEGTHAL